MWLGIGNVRAIAYVERVGDARFLYISVFYMASNIKSQNILADL